MNHQPFPRGATGPAIGVIQRLHRAGDGHREPAVRAALPEALDLIVELIGERVRRQSLDEHWDRPHDGD